MAKRILIADDSVTIQKAFAMTFGAEDVVVASARSADEGLTVARQTRPDLVIADAVMPGRSGYELCAAIKADASLRGTPVFILASSQQPYDEAKGHQVGADGHLLKPWESGSFIEKVREAIARAPASSSGAHAPAAHAPPVPTAHTRPTASSIPAMPAEDEFDVNMGSGPRTPPPVREFGRQPSSPSIPAQHLAPAASATPLRSTSQGMPAVPHPPAAGAPHAMPMRPSLIPGVRPGAVPPARPGTNPVRPVGPAAAPAAAVPPRPAAPNVGRTLMGLPAAHLPMPGSPRPGAPMAPAASPGMTSTPMSTPFGSGAAPASAPAHAPPAHAPPPAVRPPSGPATPLAARPSAAMPAVAAAVSSAVDQKVAAFAARGPEYEAIARLSREVIEQIVWEVVPELAEVIIREHVEKRGRM